MRKVTGSFQTPLVILNKYRNSFALLFFHCLMFAILENYFMNSREMSRWPLISLSGWNYLSPLKDYISLQRKLNITNRQTCALRRAELQRLYVTVIFNIWKLYLKFSCWVPAILYYEISVYICFWLFQNVGRWFS